MILCDEIYFEITFTGAKAEIKKIAKFLKSDGLEEFFDFDDSYISYDDAYFDAGDEEETWLTLSNDDYGIEIDEMEAEDFLDVFCRAAKALDVTGQMYDIDDEEIRFVSEVGSSYYLDPKHVTRFNEDEDEEPEEDDED